MLLLKSFVRGKRFAAAMLLMLASFSTQSLADTYPNKPIRLIVPFASGASNDIVARIIAPRLGQALGQPVVVENRVGAGGIVGAEFVAKSAPDGYTILIGSPGPLTLNPVLLPGIRYHPMRDFVPISLITSVPLILVVNSQSPAKSVKELIELAQAKPGTLSYASAGVGSLNHLAGELFELLARVDLLHVAYKGSNAATTDLIGGRVSMFFDNATSALTLVKTGHLRALAILGSKRSEMAPNLPTMIEAGVAGYEAGSWNGIVAPAGTPTVVVDRLSREIVKVLKQPDIQTSIWNVGAEVVASSPAEFGIFMDKELTKWERVIREANIKPNQ